jgi:hypothetical protein
MLGYKGPIPDRKRERWEPATKVRNRTQFCCNRCRDMRYLRFATRLPFFLMAETALWCAAVFGSHMLFLDRTSEALEQHRRLVDWVQGVPKEHSIPSS